MRPLRLELRGFTSFREETVVDFEDRRLFAISGPTGAGKSSLLDAITWALYGQVPRVGGSTRQLISHGEKSMSVRFDFSTRGRRYRVSRRAPGTTATRLEQMNEDGDWVPVADRAREISERVTGILGLDYQTFIRTVLLPQGAFDSFLKGDQRERREILARLLGLGVYAEVRAIAARRAGEARTRAETLEAQLRRIDAATPETIAELRSRRESLEARAATLADRRELLASLGELARADRDARRRVTEAEREVGAAAAAVTAAERGLEEARAGEEAAERRVAELERERRALGYDAQAHHDLERRFMLWRMHSQAREALDHARAALEEAERERAEATESLAATRRGAEAAAAAAQTAAGHRAERHRELAGVAAGVRSEAERLEAEANEADAEHERAQRELREREEAARQLESMCAQFEELRGELAEARSAADAARGACAEAERAASNAATARDEADARLRAAREHDEATRLRHAAVALQRSLRPGDPCPVCGEAVADPRHDPAPDLEASAQAVADAEAALAGARERSERSAAAAAAARERSDLAARRFAALEERRVELERRLGFAAEDGLPEQLRRAGAAVAAARERADRVSARAAERRGAAQRLRLSLARVPETALILVPAEEPPAATADSDLEAAGERMREAERAGDAAEQARRDAARAVEEAERLLERATRSRDQQAAAVEREADRLREHPAQDIDPDRARAELESAQQLAQRAEEIARATGDAERDRAAAREREEARASELSRARGDLARREQTLAGDRAGACDARATFEGAWRDAIGEGEPDFEALRGVMVAHAEEERRATEELGGVRERLRHAEAAAEAAERTREEIRRHEREAAVASTLDQELRGHRFIAYVQREAMQLLAADATEHLAGFTSGRYELVAEDDEFLVVDRLNGDERRSVKTLSGGETFLASLALALSLSEHLPQLSGTGGAVALESLFLDEGFGALDAESLDLAVQGLETLAGGNRMIGVISHVPELAERLPDRIEVVRRGNSSTVVSP